MESGTLWLHPSHAREDHDEVSPFNPSSSHKHVTDLKALTSFVGDVAKDHVGEAAMAKSRQVALGISSMLIGVAGQVIEDVFQSGLQVSLSGCEVSYVEEVMSQQLLLVVGRRDGVSSSRQHQEVSLMDQPFSEVWLLIVKGGEAVLQSVLNAMGSLGVVQADFDAVYKTERPISNNVANVHIATRLRRRKQRFLPEIMHPKLNDRLEEVRVAAKQILSVSGKTESQVAIVEASHLVAVQGHPNIVAFFGLFTMQPLDDHPAQWIMAMEYCCRGDLHDNIGKGGLYGEVQAMEMLAGILSALAHVHSHGIVHRDVKCENVLLGKSGRPMLSDFGLAARVDDEESMQERCGSPGYAAPEVLASVTRYNHKVDVFSCGVLLYFMVGGTLPFSGPDVCSVLRRTQRCHIRFSADSFGLVSLRCKHFITYLLSKEPEKRPDSRKALHRLWNGWGRKFEDNNGWLSEIRPQVFGEARDAQQSLAANRITELKADSQDDAKGSGDAAAVALPSASEKPPLQRLAITSEMNTPPLQRPPMTAEIAGSLDAEMKELPLVQRTSFPYVRKGTRSDTENTVPTTVPTDGDMFQVEERESWNSQRDSSFSFLRSSRRHTSDREDGNGTELLESTSEAYSPVRPPHHRPRQRPLNSARWHTAPEASRLKQTEMTPENSFQECSQRASDDEVRMLDELTEVDQMQVRPPTMPIMTKRERPYLFGTAIQEEGGNGIVQRGRRIIKRITSRRSRPPPNPAGMSGDELGPVSPVDKERPSMDSRGRGSKDSVRGWFTFNSEDSRECSSSFTTLEKQRTLDVLEYDGLSPRSTHTDNVLEDSLLEEGPFSDPESLIGSRIPPKVNMQTLNNRIGILGKLQRRNESNGSSRSVQSRQKR